MSTSDQGAPWLLKQPFGIEWTYEFADLLKESDARIVHCHVDRSVAVRDSLTVPKRIRYAFRRIQIGGS